MIKIAESDLLEFYGTECHFCIEMKPMIEKLEKELKLKIEKIEVWHNSKNAELLKKYDKGLCGGVPFFFNKKTGTFICGFADYDELKNWMLGK